MVIRQSLEGERQQWRWGRMGLDQERRESGPTRGNKLVGSGAFGSASQGQSLSLSADGNTAVVSGPQDNGFRGAAWTWDQKRRGLDATGSKLVGSDAIATASQGRSDSLSADGNTTIIGGNSNGDSGVGAAWASLDRRCRTELRGRPVRHALQDNPHGRRAGCPVERQHNGGGPMTAELIANPGSGH